MPANTVSNWENQVGELLVSDLEESEKTRQLLQLFPQLPEAGQVQIAQQLSFMLSDEDYPALGRYLMDTSLRPAVLEALLEGALLRPNEVKAPMLLSVAQDERHPKAQEARQMLEGLLGSDLSDNQAEWSAAVQQWLQANVQR